MAEYARFMAVPDVLSHHKSQRAIYRLIRCRVHIHTRQNAKYTELL